MRKIIVYILLLFALSTPLLSYSVDELVFLNDLSGQGKIGLLDTSSTVSPNNRLGFSLQVEWDNIAGSNSFWSIRQGFKQGLRLNDFDTLTFDLYLEEVKGLPNLLVFLVEEDDDRWVCFELDLTAYKEKAWHQFKIVKDQMRPWLLGNGEAEWEKIRSLAFEVQGANSKVKMKLDGALLKGKGEDYQVFNLDADDGLWADPNWNQPVRWPREPGTVIFPNLTSSDLLADQTPSKFKQLFGNFGTTGYGAEAINSLFAQEIEYAYYSASLTADFVKYLTKHSAFDTNHKGESPNQIPFSQRLDFLKFHSNAFAHPAVFEGSKRQIDALLKSGIGVWMVADYTFPWSGGRWGYAPVMIDAYRKDLQGSDEGLMVRDGARLITIHFPDYFRAYNGFYPEPEDLGWESWQSFSPPKPEENDELSRKRWVVFLYLRSYEWLKLADKVGRYYQSRGGQGLWIIPNPEDTWGSSDYVFLARSAGVSNLFPEWFGNIAHHAEAAYYSLSYLKEQAERGRTRLSLLFETGAGGHAAPYWDWRAAYNGSYVLSAASKAADFDNDFLDHATYDEMSNPQHPEFTRFRDGVSKALAFQQAREELPKPLETEILCISERPPAKATSSQFFGLNQKYSFAPGLKAANLQFQLRDSFELERNLKHYSVLAYSPWEPRVGDLELIYTWLTEQPGSVLVTHSYLPTRDTSDYGGMNPNPSIGNKDGGELLGLGKITSTGKKEFTIVDSNPEWQEFFSIGQSYNLSTPLTMVEDGEILVNTNHGPLISKVEAGGSEIIYLHYTPNDHGTKVLDMQVMKAIGKLTGQEQIFVADPETSVQVFELVNGCGFSVVVWDKPTTDKWTGVQPFPYEVSEVKRTVEFTVPWQKPVLVYDFWKDQLTRHEPEQGKISLELQDVSTALYYIGLDSPKFEQNLLKGVLEQREKIKRLQFDS